MQVILHCTPKLFVPRTNVHILIKFNNPLLPVSKRSEAQPGSPEWMSLICTCGDNSSSQTRRKSWGWRDGLCPECWFSPFLFLSCIWFPAPRACRWLTGLLPKKYWAVKPRWKNQPSSPPLHPPLSISGFYWLFDWVKRPEGKFVESEHLFIHSCFHLRNFDSHYQLWIFSCSNKRERERKKRMV